MVQMQTYMYMYKHTLAVNPKFAQVLIKCHAGNTEADKNQQLF